MARKVATRMDPETAARHRRRRILIALATTAAALVIALVIALAMLTGGPHLPREIARRIQQQEQAQRAPGGTPATSEPAVTNRSIPPGTPPLPQQLQQLQQAARSGSSGPQTLYVSDAELNQMLAAERKPDSPVKQLQAYFGEERAFITATGQWHGRELTVTMAASPVIVNGGVQFVVEDVRLGSFPAPSAVVERIQKEVQRNGGKLVPEKTGLYVQQVEIKAGVAILTGRPVPKQ